MKSQTVVVNNAYALGTRRLRNRKSGVLMWVATIKIFTTHTTACPSSRSPRLIINPSGGFFLFVFIASESVRAFLPSIQERHSQTNSKHYIRSIISLSTAATRKASMLKTWSAMVTSAVKQAGRRFVYMRTTQRHSLARGRMSEL